MLKLFNSLAPFFEDNYRRMNVRGYARLMEISPPSASKLLSKYGKEGLLNREEEKRYIYYYANKDNNLFVFLSRVYWYQKMKELISYMEREFANPVIILFGSFAKAEINSNSDIDLAVFTASRKELDLAFYEGILKKKIQVFVFKNRNEVSKDLLNNILNGFKISGDW